MNTRRKDFLKLKVRDWNKISTYEQIALVPTGRKHESGYHLIAIVGYLDNKPHEIAAWCDDVNWHFKAFRKKAEFVSDFRNDMYYPSGINHFWGRGIEFEVGHGHSSTDVVIKLKE